jgi:hypothetical protein
MKSKSHVLIALVLNFLLCTGSAQAEVTSAHDAEKQLDIHFNWLKEQDLSSEDYDHHYNRAIARIATQIAPNGTKFVLITKGEVADTLFGPAWMNTQTRYILSDRLRDHDGNLLELNLYQAISRCEELGAELPSVERLLNEYNTFASSEHPFPQFLSDGETQWLWTATKSERGSKFARDYVAFTGWNSKYNHTPFETYHYTLRFPVRCGVDVSKLPRDFIGRMSLKSPFEGPPPLSKHYPHGKQSPNQLSPQTAPNRDEVITNSSIISNL